MANENTQNPQGTPQKSAVPSVIDTYRNFLSGVPSPVNPSQFKSKVSTPINVTKNGAPTIKDWNSKFSEIANIKVEPLRYSQVSQFGAGSEGFNLKRYYAHPDANILGINPANFDIENYYNEKGRVGGDFVRMAKYLPSTAYGFTKDYLKPWAHPSDLLDAKPDLESAKDYHDGMSIMMSSKPGFAGSSVNFFANLAPTLGIAAGVLVEEGTIAAAQFGASRFPGLQFLQPAISTAEARAGKNILTIPKILERGKNIKTALGAFAKADNVTKLRTIWEGQKGLGGIKGISKGFIKEVNPLKNTAQGFRDAEHLEGIAAFSKNFGGFFKDVQRVRFAVNEAQTEGGGAILERIEAGRQEYAAIQQKEIKRISDEMSALVDQNNNVTDIVKYEALSNELNTAKLKLASGPTGNDASQILNIAEQNGKAVTLLNLPIIYATNAFGFEKIIGHGTVRRSLSDQFVKKYGKHLVKSSIVGAAGKASYELIEDNIKKWGKKAYIRHVMMQTPGRLLDYLGKNVPEGIQELFQEGAIKGVDHYYTTKFQDPLKYHRGVLGESILVGANSQYSKEGLEVFLQGLLSGGAIYTGTSLVKSIASPITDLVQKKWMGEENYKTYAEQLDAEANRVLTAAQKSADDPNDFLKIFDKAAGEQINYARVGDVAEALGDEKDQRDIRNDATISYVHTLSQAGRLDVLIDNLKEMRELSAQELAEALGEEYVEADQAKYFDRLEKSINNVQDLGERFEKFREMMPNRYDPSKVNRKTEPGLYQQEVNNYHAHEEAIFFGVYASKTFEETLDRMQKIQEKFAAIPSFARMPGMRASKIFSVSQMQDDVQSLRTQARILEENGDKQGADKLIKQADTLENLANSSSIFSTLQSLAGKSTLSKAEEKELEALKKVYAENLAKSNKEKETEYTLEDLTSQDALDEYEQELRKAFDDYFNEMTSGTESRPFLKQELDDMFTMYRDWHMLGSDNRNMARWVNMLTDPNGFNEFKNNIAISLANVYKKRNDILREQKKKFMKGMIQNAFLKKLFEQARVFVSVEDLEAFEKNDRYPTLIDSKTLQPIRANDPRMPMIEEMFDNYEKVYNKVVKERPIVEKGAEQQILEEFFSSAHKKKSSQDNRGVLDYAAILGIEPNEESKLSLDELCDFVINSKFATPVEKKLAQKLKALGLTTPLGDVTIRFNHSAPVTYDTKNGIVIDFRYASPNYKGGNYRAEYLVLKGMMMALTTDFLEDKEFADEVEEMMTRVKNTLQSNPSLLDMFDGKSPIGLASPQAFISEVMTNPSFQALLGQVKSTREVKTSIFNDLIKAIRKFIRNVFNIRNASDSVLQQATALVGLTIEQSDYLQEPGKRRKSPTEEAIVSEPKDELLEEVTVEEEEETLTTKEKEGLENLTPEEKERYEKLLKAQIKAIEDALKSGLGVTPLAVFVDGSLIPFDEANAEIEALKKKKNGEKAKETDEEKVAKFRALEQEELRKVIPNIDSYRDAAGNIDKSKLTGIERALYEQIYAKYDKLISPLLATEPATETTTEEVPEVTPTEEEPVEEVLSEDEIDAIDINTPVSLLPKDLYDLLYAEYKKMAAIIKSKETPGGFANFVSTNAKSAKIIKDWKEAKKAEPVEEKPEELPVDNNKKIREELLARGWLPEDINGLTEEQLGNLHASGTTKEEALAMLERNAEFAEADKKVAAFIAKLAKNLEDSGVVKVPGGYEKDGNKLARVSDIVRDILQKKFTNTTAANRGNVLDPIFRDFFDGKLVTAEDVKQKLEELAGKVDSESGEKMMTYTATFPAQLFNTMQGIKQYLNAKGLKIIGGIPTLFGDIAGPRAGEIDFLFYDKNGNLGIIDLKTSTRNLVDSYNDPADEYQYERGHTIQQLAYRELIRQATGEDIKDIYILPIQLFTNPDGSVKNLDTLNTGTEENPAILLKLNTSRDIFEVTGYGRPAGSEAVTRTQEEEDALAEKEKAKQERRIEGLKEKLAKLRGQQIAAISSANLTKIKELGDKIAKIIDELKLYGVTVEDVAIVPEEVTEEPTTVKPEVGMIIKLNDGRIVKVKKVSKKEVTVVPLNNEDAEGEILDEAVVEDLDKMVVSTGKKKKAPAPKPETEEVMTESKSNAETLSNDKDAQAKLASEAEKMSKAEVKNNFLDKLKNRCE